VTIRTVVVALILVESKIEFCTMLDDGHVKRTQQHVVFVVQLRNGNDQQTMILSDVAVYNR
jgi:hypothetical protein